MSTATLDQLRAETTRAVEAVLDDPEARMRLRASFYERPGTTDQHGRSELDFMRWEITRGVLAPMRAPKPGSPWWRAVNAAVLFHGALALACEAHGVDLGALDLPTAQWVRYLRARTDAAWWRAHNASILTGYLAGVDLARREIWAEQRFMNAMPCTPSSTLRRDERSPCWAPGPGGISAALALTDPANPASRRVEVTVHQMGWRIGRNGASGRDSDASWLI
jgi:hypothetical protein